MLAQDDKSMMSQNHYDITNYQEKNSCSNSLNHEEVLRHENQTSSTLTPNFDLEDKN